MQEQPSCTLLRLIHLGTEPEMLYALFQQVFVLHLVQSTCDSSQLDHLVKGTALGRTRRATLRSVDEPRAFLRQPRRTDSKLDTRHVLLPNDRPDRPCWVPMEPSWLSQLDPELKRAPLDVAIRLLAVSFLALLEPWVVLPTVPGRVGREELQPRYFHPQPCGCMLSIPCRLLGLFRPASHGSDSS